MSIPKVTYIFDRYSKASSDIPGILEMRITYNRKQKYISTGIKLLPNQWSGEVVVNTPDAVILNKTLDKLLTDVRQVIFTMMSEDNIDIFSIPERLKQNERNNISFLEFCMQRMEVRKYGKTKDSQARYDRFYKLFSKWGKIKYFDDIKESNVILFDKYLLSRNLKPYSKWNNYHRFLNSFILDAIDEGLLTRNPYKWINIIKDKSSTGINKYLSPSEFKTIENTKMHTESLERIKDLFIFQTYTCLSYKDLKVFNPNNIKKIKDMYVYTGTRVKTHHTFTIPLMPTAVRILEKYDYNLPVISNVKYNQYLKIVAQTSGIDKPLSSHWARHTGATLLLNNGIDMRMVSKICGHSSTRITEQVYAKLLDETIVDAVKGINGEFK